MESVSLHPSSEILIRKPIWSLKNFRIHPYFQSEGILANLTFRSGKLYREIIPRNDPESPIIDPERFYLSEEKILVFRMTEVGRYHRYGQRGIRGN